MKKIFVIVPALAVLFSCAKIAELSQDETQASALSVVTTFEATPDAGVIPDEEGKATINPTDGVVSWEAGDAILVSNGSTQAVYTYDENEDYTDKIIIIAASKDANDAVNIIPFWQ